MVLMKKNTSVEHLYIFPMIAEVENYERKNLTLTLSGSRACDM